jgi:hypothetical protein
LYLKYKKLAEKLTDTYFVGRLGTYKYYNMDQVVAQSLTLFKRILHEETHRNRDAYAESILPKNHSIAKVKNGSLGGH